MPSFQPRCKERINPIAIRATLLQRKGGPPPTTTIVLPLAPGRAVPWYWPSRQPDNGSSVRLPPGPAPQRRVHPGEAPPARPWLTVAGEGGPLLGPGVPGSARSAAPPHRRAPDVPSSPSGSSSGQHHTTVGPKSSTFCLDGHLLLGREARKAAMARGTPVSAFIVLGSKLNYSRERSERRGGLYLCVWLNAKELGKSLCLCLAAALGENGGTRASKV